MRRFLFAALMISAIAVNVGCGSDNQLGSIGDEQITREEYLSVFNGLPAEEQVAVLEPGGRMALMERIVRKRLLLAAWAEDPTISEPWEEAYSMSVLSDSMFRRIALQFDRDAFLDSLSSSGYSEFALRTVLLDDSADAVMLAEKWNSGDFDNSMPSILAPWSSAGTASSYKTFSGPVHRISATFTPFLDMDMGVAHVIPMYGEWCVGQMELQAGEWVTDDAVVITGLLNFISGVSGEQVLAKGVVALAENCTVAGSRIIPTGEGSDVPVAVAQGDTLTVNYIMETMRTASDYNFFGGVPEELAYLSPPEISYSPEVTLWYHVKAVAQYHALAELALQEGITVPDGALDYARAESVVRERVLRASEPDSADVENWYNENTDKFPVPERRSVLLGYTIPGTVNTFPASFSDVPGIETILDENGEIVATPPQLEEAFGTDLGAAVFSADAGVLTGPVSIQGELDAWFEVVEIVEPCTASLDEIYPVVVSMAASDMFTGTFDELIENLRTTYPVEIDTTAVVEVDLWGGLQ